MMTRKTAPLLWWFLLAFACSGRMAFDTHSIEGMGSEEPTDEPKAGGGVGASSGNESAGNGAAPSDGGSGGTDDGSGGTDGGSGGTDGGAECGGARSEGGADADEAYGTDLDSDDLLCGERDANCTRCLSPADCARGWLCDPVLRICVECSSDADCPQGITCDEHSRRCE